MSNALLYSGILAEFNPLEPITGVTLFSFTIGQWRVDVSNHMVIVALAGLILLTTIPWAMHKNGSYVPKGLRNVFETICVYFREEMARPFLKERTDKYIGFIWTLFFFILTLNLLSLIPIEKFVTLITGKPSHFGGAPTANIWITGALAMIVFVMTHIVGIREQGLFLYLKHLAPPVPWWISPLIYFLEIVSSLIRPFTLAIRLFANIVGGHIIIATIIGFILLFKNYGVAFASVIMSSLLMLLDLLVAFVQAFIFAFLCTLYIAFAAESEH